MASFAGLRGTDDWGTSERPQNFRELILWSNPNGRAPLTALLSKMKKEGVNDPQFHWWEEEQNIIRITTDTNLSATSTAASTAAGALALVKGDVLMFEKDTATFDNELVLVTAVTNDTTFTIVRAQAGTTGANIPSGSALLKVGNVYEEGSNAPDVSQRNPTKYTNYCQIFKTACGITGTADETHARTGDAWKNDKKRKAFDHSVAMELAFLYGRGHEDTAGTYPKRYTKGLRAFISTNVTVFSTTPTEETILDALYKVFDFDAGGAGDERIIFAGNGALNAFNKVVLNSSSSRVNYDGVIDLFGMKLMRWITPQGTFGVRTHPLLNVHPLFTNSMFVVNPMGIVYRPLRDTMFQDNIQANDADTRKAQWLTECGLELHHEKTFAYLGNVTSP